MSYRDYQAQVSPPWIDEPWPRALGDVKDSLVDRAKQAIKARMPSLAPSDALAVLAEERRIERGALETKAAFAERVRLAWDEWQWGGTPKGLLRQLFRLYPTADIQLVQVTGKRYSLSDLDTLTIEDKPWLCRATDAFWSEFQLIFPGPHPWSGTAEWTTHVGTGTIMQGGTPDGAHRVDVSITATASVGSGTLTADVDIDLSGSPTTVSIPAHGIVSLDEDVGPCGITLTFEGSHTTGDAWTLTTTSAIPAETSEEVLHIKRLVRRWKPAHARCVGVIVHTAGNLYGWPDETYGSDGYFGGTNALCRLVWSVD